MFKSIELFQSAHQMASHAARQQAVVATNLANVDTPDFKAMTMPNRQEGEAPLPMKQSRFAQVRTGHIAFDRQIGGPAPIRDPEAAIAPNGNSVSLEREMLKSIDAERQHSRALTVYQTSLDILRTSIGRGR